MTNDHERDGDGPHTVQGWNTLHAHEILLHRSSAETYYWLKAESRVKHAGLANLPCGVLRVPVRQQSDRLPVLHSGSMTLALPRDAYATCLQMWSSATKGR